MGRRRLASRTVLAAALLGCGLCRPGVAAGFDFYEQGSKAMGMAGAFVAQADDLTAIFYNIGGLALVEEKKAAVGLTLFTLNESLYQGLPPGIGVNTASAQDTFMVLQPHAYAALPFKNRFKIGIGIYSPFFLQTRWSDPDRFAGRAIATSAKLVTYDLNAAISYRLTPKIGLGLGLVYRNADLSVGRRFFAENPFTGTTQDIASISFEQDFSTALGWNGGILYKLNDRFSLGFSYRSGISVDYTGVARLTQIPTGNAQLDSLFAASFPFDFDLPTSASIDFPASGVFGVAYGVTPAILVELDLQWTAWSGFDALELRFLSAPLFDQTIRQDFDDTLSLRAGVQLTTATGTQYRVGYAFDESPQPDTTLGAFLTDGSRNLLTLGFGKDWLDVAFTWVNVEQRIITNQVDGLNGNYRSNAWKLALTVSM